MARGLIIRLAQYRHQCVGEFAIGCSGFRGRGGHAEALDLDKKLEIGGENGQLGGYSLRDQRKIPEKLLPDLPQLIHSDQGVNLKGI